MNRFRKQNEQNIIEYLSGAEKDCPGLIELLYPIVSIASDFIEKLRDYIDFDFETFEYEKLNISENIKLVREFLSKEGNGYLENFDKALTDGTFDMFLPEFLDEEESRSLEPRSCEEDFVNLNIPINNTIDDGAAIIHEFFHFTNSEYDMGTRIIFTEFISSYMELKYYLFLAEKGYTVDNYYKCLYEKIDNTFVAASNVAFSGGLLDIYENTGKINRKNIKFIDKFRCLYKPNIKGLINYYSDEDLEEDLFLFHYDVSYLLGGILAINSLKEPILSDTRIKYINENFDKLSIKDVLNVFELDIENFSILIDYCAEKMKEVEGVLNENNSYSGANKRR